MATEEISEPMGSGKFHEIIAYLRIRVRFCSLVDVGRRKLQGALDELVQQSKEVEDK